MKRSILKAVAVAALVGGTATPAYADGTWSGNGSYCGGSLFQTCISISMSWTGSVVTLTMTNLSGEGDLFKAVGLGSLADPGRSNSPGTAGFWSYLVTGQSGYQHPPPNDFGGGPILPAVANAVSNDQNSMIADGQTGTWYFTFSGVTGSFDSFIQNAGVGVHAISGPGGCSTKLYVNANDTFNAGPYDPNCQPPTVVPEPATMVLLASGLVSLAGVGYMRRRRKDSIA